MMGSRRGLPWIDLVEKVSVYLLFIGNEIFRDQFCGESEFRVV